MPLSAYRFLFELPLTSHLFVCRIVVAIASSYTITRGGRYHVSVMKTVRRHATIRQCNFVCEMFVKIFHGPFEALFLQRFHSSFAESSPPAHGVDCCASDRKYSSLANMAGRMASA
jgi:hypothetical protein